MQSANNGKNCSSDREKLLKFEAEGREFAKNEYEGSMITNLSFSPNTITSQDENMINNIPFVAPSYDCKTA